MDLQIASKKLLFTIVLLSLMYIVGLYWYRKATDSDTVTLCSNGRHISAVFHFKIGGTVLIPSSNVKDTLDCLGRGMSFYDRTIEYVIQTSSSEGQMNALRSRYSVISEIRSAELEATHIEDLSQDSFKLGTSPKIVVYLKNISNPFQFINNISQQHIRTIIVPELGEVMLQMIAPSVKRNNQTIIELQEGEYITLEL